MERDVKYYVNRYNNLKQRRDNLRPKWTKINKYVRNGGSLYDDVDDEGASDRVYESTAPDALRKFVSVLMGLLWPSTKKSARLKPIDEIPETEENKKFFDKVSNKMDKRMDSPRSGFTQALEMYLADLGSFGTGGIFISEDPDTVVRYKAWGIKHIVIDEGENGMVNVVYYADRWTAKQIVETYGYEKVSKKVKEAYDSVELGNAKFKIIQAIEPVMIKDREGVPMFEWESVTFELDDEHVLKEGRFEEFPCPISRYYKDSDNTYGKSPAMICYPAIMEINTKVSHREMIEKQEIEPSLGYDVNAIRGDVLDSTPGTNTPFDMSLGGASNPVFRLIPPINVNITDRGIERLEEKISQAFNLDRLLDFNNNQQMTATEAGLRANIRGQANNAIFARQDAEMFTPLIERTFNIMFRAGEFGVIQGSEEHQELMKENENRAKLGLPIKPVEFIPEDIAKVMETGRDFYEVTYISPASSMRESESLQGLINSVTQIAQLAQIMPQVMDNIDPDAVARKVLEFNRAPMEIMVAKEARDEKRQAQAEQQQLQQQQMNQSNQLTVEQQQQDLEQGEAPQ